MRAYGPVCMASAALVVMAGYPDAERRAGLPHRLVLTGSQPAASAPSLSVRGGRANQVDGLGQAPSAKARSFDRTGKIADGGKIQPAPGLPQVIMSAEAKMTTQPERTNWTIYPTARDAHAAAREEAASTGVIQYVIKKPSGFIVTPDNSADPSAASFLPPYDLNYTVQGKVPRELTAADIAEVETLARADSTQDFYELLAARMYRLSQSEITDQHIYAVKQEVMRIRDRSAWNEPSGKTTLKIID